MQKVLRADDATPGVAAASLQRARAMAMLREQGHSLDEIALRFGVSRERVRQILRAHGGPDAGVVVQARRRRAEQQAVARIEELLERWRAGEEPRSTAGALGLQAVACRNVIACVATESDRAARKASIAHARAVATTYSDLDIVTALTSAASSLGRVPSAKEYDALRTRGGPSVATVLNRMDGWTNAVRAAGLTPHRMPARTRSRRWTADACWAAIRAVVAELEQIPTVVTYDRHAASRPDLPSSATLRNRLGRWSAITTTLAAERERRLARAAP